MNEDHSTPKKEKQERISKHKENLQHTQAEEEAHLLTQQRLYYDRNCRFFKRKIMIKRHEVEQQNIREVSVTPRRPRGSGGSVSSSPVPVALSTHKACQGMKLPAVRESHFRISAFPIGLKQVQSCVRIKVRVHSATPSRA